MLYHALYKSPIDTESLSPTLGTVNGHFFQPSNVQYITVVIVFKKCHQQKNIFTSLYQSMAQNLN